MASQISLKPDYLNYLQKTADTLTTIDGRPIPVWELVVATDDPCFSDWASRFRQFYCLDAELDDLRQGTGKSRAEYLSDLVFPSRSENPGPAIRSGDFAELMISDFVEHVLCYWVPREKYGEKASPNESVKGVDILGFRIGELSSPSLSDTLLLFEVKAQLTNTNYTGRLQTAIDDSSKDYIRAAFTLNATKRRLIKADRNEHAGIVQRFQNITDHPYTFRSGAAAVLSETAYDTVELQKSSTATHNNTNNLELLVVRGNELMSLVHTLYQRAADEA